MADKYIYLSGYMNVDEPITEEWRSYATKVMTGHNIKTLNPWRGKNLYYFDRDDVAKNHSRLIVERDLEDIKRADIILINLNSYNIKRQMIGTLAELGAAGMLHKPTIVFAAEDEPNLNHPWVSGIATRVCYNLVDALNWTIWLASEHL